MSDTQASLHTFSTCFSCVGGDLACLLIFISVKDSFQLETATKLMQSPTVLRQAICIAGLCVIQYVVPHQCAERLRLNHFHLL